MMPGSVPAVVTSQRCIVYRESSWCVHEFEVQSGLGSVVCRAAVLRMTGSLLLWTGIGGAGAGGARLTELAAGTPGASTTLVGDDGYAAALARRLATLLSRPVFVCCGDEFDRFTAPLVERGIVAEIKSRPECF